jgi:peptidoglycan/xylan/chitin deacetylase (PgdA/CDA1 family)
MKPKPVFTVSIDLELLWGTLDREYSGKFRSICQTERRCVIDRLLQLFTEYRIEATWAVVGNLFQAERSEDDLLRAADLIGRIRRCPVPQEIGCHTLSHAVLGECPRAVAERELSECARIASENGLELSSLVFPRNRVGHLDVARRLGFTCYRGAEPHWYAGAPRAVRRIGHLAEILAAHTPPAVQPAWENGIWNIPGSMLYTPSFGIRRLVPVWLRVLRARRGLANAVRANRIFHLWFHPTDLVIRMDAMLDGLRQILSQAARLRDQGRLAILPMRDLAAWAAAAAVDRDSVTALAPAARMPRPRAGSERPVPLGASR